jgi:hypothetical protein
MDTLTPRARLTRVVATLIGAALLLGGTLIGQDDDFPFGPFRMYATTDKLNAPVGDTRVDGVDANGAAVALDENATGIRRAEIEGAMPLFRKNPALLHVVADAYDSRHPGSPKITEVNVIIRWHDLRDGRPTGEYHDETVVTWAVTP